MENVGYDVYRLLIDSSLNHVFNGIPLKKWSDHKEETGKYTAFFVRSSFNPFGPWFTRSANPDGDYKV